LAGLITILLFGVWYEENPHIGCFISCFDGR
jgi:hypothetical protein